MQRIIQGWLFTALIAVFLSGCNNSEIENLKKENGVLKAEIQKLKETADFHFKSGQDHLAAQDFESAVKSFETVVNKYPNDPLAGSAKESLKKAEEAWKEQKKRLAEQEQAAKAAAENEVAESGEEIGYGAFYAKSITGLTIGKRYRFHACLSAASSCVINISMSVDQNICDIEPEFDDQSEYEAWLSNGTKYCGPIVASMRYGGTIGIHRLH